VSSSLAERFPALTAVAASERTLPVHQSLIELLPAIQRGSTIACGGRAGVSLALALAAAPSQEGAWVGVAGLPELGVRAAADMGVALQRLVMVAGDPPWTDVLAAMIDGFDVILVGRGVGNLGSGAVRRLQARAQTRGVVMLTMGVPALGADLQLTAADDRWRGLGDGHGVATGRRVLVEVAGRRMPRPRRATMWLPDANGAIATAITPGVDTFDTTLDTTLDTVRGAEPSLARAN
jgi:HAD-hyrolase-like